MTSDSSQPFRDLAARLAARERADKDGQKAGEDARPLKTPAAPGPRPADEAGDAALFLDAVSRIRPLPKKSNRGGGADLGDALAAGLRERQAGEGLVFSGGQSADSRSEEPAPPVAAPAPQAGRALPPPDGAAQPGSVGGFFPGGEGGALPHGGEDEDESLFAKAMRGVAPVGGRGRSLAPLPGASRPVPALDPAEALREVLEGRVEFALHHTDEFMEGFVVGTDPLVLARLRAGRYSPEKHVDLHGMNARQAHEALTAFIKDAYQRTMRCVVVVTGRGRNSPGGVGVLRPLLQAWLTRDPFKRVVIAFCTARPGDGGPGAVYVLLRKYKKSRGRIIWDRTPADDDFPDL